jgi:hypothetical protein
MPEIFRYLRFKVFFWMNEEPRMHVHVESPDGESVKVWLEPEVKAGPSKRLKPHEVARIVKMVEKNKAKCIKAWRFYHG